MLFRLTYCAFIKYNLGLLEVWILIPGMFQAKTEYKLLIFEHLLKNPILVFSCHIRMMFTIIWNEKILKYRMMQKDVTVISTWPFFEMAHTN